MDEAVFNRRRLRVQTHNFVAVRFDRSNGGKAFLDQVLHELRAGGLVFDQNRRRAKQSMLLRKSDRKYGSSTGSDGSPSRAHGKLAPANVVRPPHRGSKQ
jgi:hypothetical protein